ncbi:glycosyltransferase family 4 protein [Rubeoparvulum massiliense]|uniref:glycosyltransferase family 4 protein n=1 Tax=Rubeoparvulum massiliense TaxID=1631346 RepID=UPI00065E1F64|nr:MraY family glycosyltransferase [Rubeoparvulum massiliense]
MALLPYFFPLFSSFLLVWLFLPLINRWAVSKGLVDVPYGRKIHIRPIPLTGGITIYGCFLLLIRLWVPPDSLLWSLVIGGGGLVAIGVLDDWYKSQQRELSPLPKLLAQLGVSLLAFLLGIRFQSISYPWNDEGMIQFPLGISFILTLLWITAFINMFNFMDGADGLASGVSLISLLTMMVIAVALDQHELALMAVLFIGAIAAFLRYNFHPAQAFLGDAGSMLLGYVVAVTSLSGMMKGPTLFTLLATLLIVGLPLVDMVQVMVRRWRRGTPLYRADKNHLHHLLFQAGLSHRQVVLVLYLCGLFFSILSLYMFFAYLI